jgi:hypothetical protein
MQIEHYGTLSGRNETKLNPLFPSGAFTRAALSLSVVELCRGVFLSAVDDSLHARLYNAGAVISLFCAPLVLRYAQATSLLSGLSLLLFGSLACYLCSTSAGFLLLSAFSLGLGSGRYGARCLQHNSWIAPHYDRLSLFVYSVGISIARMMLFSAPSEAPRSLFMIW